MPGPSHPRASLLSHFRHKNALCPGVASPHMDGTLARDRRRAHQTQRSATPEAQEEAGGEAAAGSDAMAHDFEVLRLCNPCRAHATPVRRSTSARLDPEHIICSLRSSESTLPSPFTSAKFLKMSPMREWLTLMMSLQTEPPRDRVRATGLPERGSSASLRLLRVGSTHARRFDPCAAAARRFDSWAAAARRFDMRGIARRFDCRATCWY
jgi:hypothetical protein